ncbi:unnamed protein product [Caenorhabditis auriculariae]|uniref:EF-hand domain-containing protein n=1 Tax=Caenorhabditis auriculariae TaxID=2777116 RepID=A0A8S1GZ35_9PELO|nr:unnamed protein product [Caenorhabditis auriculariae]
MGQLYSKSIRRIPVFGVSVDKAIAKDFDLKINHKPDCLDYLLKKTRFSRQELKYLYQAFKQSCPKGFVEKQEFFQILKGFYCIRHTANAEPYASLMYDSLDPNAKGFITFTEFACNLSLLMRGALEEKLEWIFNLYDGHSRGYLLEDDFVHVYKAVLSLTGPITMKDRNLTIIVRKRIKKSFLKFDANKDGRITRNEFINCCLNDRGVLHALETFKVSW